MGNIAAAHSIRLVEDTGATILLKLATNAVANFSVDGRVWYPLLARGVNESTGSVNSYVFTGGIAESNGVVTIDTNVVVTLNAQGKIDSSLLPPILTTTQNGLAISEDGTLYVGEPNVAGNVVVADSNGRIPDSLLPVYPKTFSNGLSLSVDGVLAVTEYNTPGNIVVVPEGGKLPTNLLPEQELPDIATDYSNGLTLVDGTLGVDDASANTPGNLVTVPETGKLPDSILPIYPKSFDNGLAIDDAGNLYVSEPNAPGNLVLVSDDGKLDDSLLPTYPKSYGNGMALSDAGELYISEPNKPGNAVVLDDAGKLPREAVPVADPVNYSAGLGIKIENNVISEDWKDYR